LISISESGIYFYYLIWIPSEGGPLISKFGKIKSPEGFNFKNGDFTLILEQIVNEVQGISPRFQLSLDSNNILLSQTYYNSEDFISWQNTQIRDLEFETIYHTYSFPFSNENSLLNIHLRKEYKKGIVNSIQDVYGELRAINIGIFSAEIGARQWFYANQLESYAIWKMGKNHVDQLLIVRGGEFQSWVTLKRLKTAVKVLNIIGDSTLVDKIVDQIRTWSNNDLDEFIHIERVFVYSSEPNSKDLKKIIDAEISNVTLLNLFEVLDITTEEKVNPLKGSTYAETGVGFRGIDV